MKGNFCQLFFISFIFITSPAVSFSQITGDCVSPEIKAVLQPSCKSTSNGAIKLNISGGMPPYQVDWSQGSSLTHLKGLKPGEYQVVVTDVLGCVSQKVFRVSEAPELQAQINVVHNRRAGRSKGVIEVEVFGGKAPYRFSWISNNLELQTAPTPGENSKSGLPAGWYKVVIFDAANCFYEIETEVR